MNPVKATMRVVAGFALASLALACDDPASSVNRGLLGYYTLISVDQNSVPYRETALLNGGRIDVTGGDMQAYSYDSLARRLTRQTYDPSGAPQGAAQTTTVKYRLHRSGASLRLYNGQHRIDATISGAVITFEDDGKAWRYSRE